MSDLFGIPGWLSVVVATVALIVIGLSGCYRRIERIGIVVGLFEMFFIIAAFMAHPRGSEMAKGLVAMPLSNPSYLFLLAANVGAVIIPWMVFYQQGAVIDKGLDKQHLKAARRDRLFGSVITQIIMISIVIVTAATIGKTNPNQPLNDIQQIAQGLIPFLGVTGAKVIFGLGMIGASFIATLVVSIAGAWGIGEAFGFNLRRQKGFT